MTVYSVGCLVSVVLSLSNKPLDNIEGRRQDVLEQLLNCIFNAFDTLRAGTCTPECDSMLLGSLIRQLKVVDLVQPRPSRPVHDLSIAMVVEAVGNLSSPQWYSLPEVKAKYEKHEIVKSKKWKKHETRRTSPIPDYDLFEHNIGSASSETWREGHSCVLDRFFHQVKDIDAGVRGLSLYRLMYTKKLPGAID